MLSGSTVLRLRRWNRDWVAPSWEVPQDRRRGATVARHAVKAKGGISITRPRRTSQQEPIDPKPLDSPKPSTADLRRLQAQQARRRRAQEAVASLTADEINEFLAHSDHEDDAVDDDIQSEASSDWDDVQDESELPPELMTSTTSSAQECGALAVQSAIRDVGVSELFQTVNPIPSSNLTNDAEEDIFSYSDARRSELSEYGSQIKASLSSAASERHEKRVERYVRRAIQAEEEQAVEVTQTPSDLSVLTTTDSQKKTLEMCTERRERAIASLGGGAPSSSSSAKAGDYFVAAPTSIRVMRPQINSELWSTRTSGRRVFGLAQYLREATGSNASSLHSETTVLVAVVGARVAPRRSRNDKIFSIWRLTDLASIGVGATNGHAVSLFLFGAVHEKLWKEPEGTVVAILKPKQLPPSEHDSGNGGKEVSITVDSAPFVMVLGTSPDHAVCAGTTKAGRPCTRIVNKSVCRYCDFHVKSAYYSASSTRAGFTTTSFPRTGGGIKRPVSGGGFLGGGGGVTFSLQRPATMPSDRSQDTRFHNGHPLSGRQVALSMAKLTSAGYAIDPASSSLCSASSSQQPKADFANGSASTLSDSEAVFAASLSRPTMGSLNLLRHLEKSSSPVSSTSSVTSNRKAASVFQRRSLVPPPPPKPNETFANFFAGLKKTQQKTAVVPKQPQFGSRMKLVGGGTGEEEDDKCFIDLGPVNTLQQQAPSKRLTSSPAVVRRFGPAGEQARRRTEALVRARGGIRGLEKDAKAAAQKRIVEAVERSANKKPRPSPLSQILDKASVASPSQPAKENLDPEDGKSTAVENEELVKRRREKREELARLVQQGSGHTDLAAAEENLAEKKMLSRLEARDAIEEKLLAQHEQECQVVACLTCNYRSLRANMSCRKAGHQLEYSSGTRRFFACRNCKKRTSTLDRYPQFACANCGDSLFEKTGAIAERKGPKLANEKLLVRGLEEKYLG